MDLLRLSCRACDILILPLACHICFFAILLLPLPCRACEPSSYSPTPSTLCVRSRACPSTPPPPPVPTPLTRSPVVDGIVRRMAKDGKEMRFVTPLSEDETSFARKICIGFKQTVCGFDLLRVDGKSYVIDVNGWSFVKGNEEYYDMCAKTLRTLFLESLQRRTMAVLSREPSTENQWRLKAFLSVFRHGDRTPKQKLKFYVSSEPFVNLLNGSIEEVLLKKSADLRLVIAAAEKAKAEGSEDVEKMDQLIVVLEKKNEYPGTKVQIKPSFSKVDGLLDRMLVIVKWGGEFTHAYVGRKGVGWFDGDPHFVDVGGSIIRMIWAKIFVRIYI